MRYVIQTLGCKANLLDSQLIEAELRKRGWAPARDARDARLCIVNSCTVTDEADRQSRKLAARLARENPDARVVVTGCGAEVEPERLARSKGIHYVVGNRDKPRMIDLVLEKLAQPAAAEGMPVEGSVLGLARSYGEMLSRHPIDREWPMLEGALADPSALDQTLRTRAFVKIQEGCNAFCTYCVIPYGRGPGRSLTIDEVVERVRGLVDAGTREVVLTGTNIGDYGADWSKQLEPLDEIAALCEAILSRTKLERLRVGSLDPTEISDRMLRLAAAEPRFCPHFHVSLQSPHPRVLRAMKRKYSSAEVERCLAGIARVLPHAYVGMDIITGFPGETDAEFEESYAALARLPWTRLHVFPYSERAGTPATRLPGAVPPPVRAARAGRLRRLSLERVKATYERVLEAGRPVDGILVEAGGVGHAPNYLRVMFSRDGRQPSRNTLVSAWPTKLYLDEAAGEASLVVQY